MRKTKFWICGQVGCTGEEHNITRLTTNVFPYFDGACWVVNHSHSQYPLEATLSKTYAMLDTSKKEGRIMVAPWVNINGMGMTMALQAGPICLGDWVLMIDAQEEPQKPWLENMRAIATQYESEDIGCMMWGRPYFFRFHPSQTYPQTTHVWPQPLMGKAISIQDESKVKRPNDNECYFGDFIINRKNPDNSMLLHSAKYFVCHNITNETENMYGRFGRDVVIAHERTRQVFRQYCIQALGLNMNTLDDLLGYFRRPDAFEDAVFLTPVENEHCLKTLYRYYILKQTRQDILANRYDWSIVKYLRTRDLQQSRQPDYVGVHNFYLQKSGAPPE